MEKQNVGGGWSKASLVLGVISAVLALLPLVSAWFMLLIGINYLLVPIGIICGVVAIVKSQNLTKSVIGLVLCVLAILLPFIMAEMYVESSLETVGNSMDAIGGFLEALE